MYIDINKHEAKYITVLIEKRLSVIKNRILKENKNDWYDYEPPQIETKLCEASDEYFRLSKCLNDFYSTAK
jgi:hypothetical protein